ncbi:MAG: thiol-disulfide oxidoreductase [Pirellulaceae bacterium]|nr:MAG: thiol-disulfide oxidoreductase [Pirellulaceae bacterium]
MSEPTGDEWQVEVFYDGECPLCLREIRMLRWMDRKKNIRFTDIADPTFRPSNYGKSKQEFMAEIQGRLPDGSWITGVEVFRRLYAAVGLGPLVALARLPGVSFVLDLGYRIFAKNRLRLTGRCSTGACEVN